MRFEKISARRSFAVVALAAALAVAATVAVLRRTPA